VVKGPTVKIPHIYHTIEVVAEKSPKTRLELYDNGLLSSINESNALQDGLDSKKEKLRSIKI
jgi:hypothetical protein